MEINIRNFEQHDYDCCENLVNEAWHFDKIFTDKNLSETALRIYTKSGICSGNVNLVAINCGKVAGFLFGFNHLTKKNRKGRIKLTADALYSFNFKKMDKTERDKFIQALANHNKNRTAIEPGNASEICLFVVSKDLQGKHIGTRLWEAFRDSCIASGVERIRVETNKLGASGYYEKQGFTLVGDFNSPLHELSTPGGQACMYEYFSNLSTHN